MNLNSLCLFWSLVGRMVAEDYYDYGYDYGDMPEVPDWPYKVDDGKGKEKKIESGPESGEKNVGQHAFFSWYRPSLTQI